MSGTYYIAANQDQGGHWSFTEDQIRRTAAEIRADAAVFGPDEPHQTFLFQFPGEERRTLEVMYQAETMMFSFQEQDEIKDTGGFVLRFLQRLAPQTPAMWVADFDGGVNEFLPAGFTVDGFIREIWGEPA